MSHRLDRLVLVASFLHLLLITALAWFCDDAYISFRTVDNFINGYGLRWNIADRVQGFTHPLWVLILAPFSYVTGDVPLTAFALSLLLSAGTLILMRSLIVDQREFLLAVLLLTLSRAYTQFSTSGLENPLLHFVVAGFAALSANDVSRPRNSLLLGLALSGLFLTRPDAVLFAVPLLLYRLRALRLGSVFVGLLPALLWEVFALIYFGFPFPNTAYVKLATGEPRTDLLFFGGYYLLKNVLEDPFTLLSLLTLGLVGVAQGGVRRMLVLGAWAYVAYIVWIGGDFMRGRLLSAPLLLVIIAAVPGILTFLPRRFMALSAATIFVAACALSIIAPTLIHRPAGHVRGCYDEMCFSDEWGCYVEWTSPWKANRRNPWAEAGAEQRRLGGVVVQDNVGFYGYAAGPGVHIIDRAGLTDPLIARLHRAKTLRFCPGHNFRLVPEGYQEWVEGKENLPQSDLRVYVEALGTITRGPLFSKERLKLIWDFNTGKYNFYLWKAFQGAEAAA